METDNIIYYTKEKIKKDLEYWSKKKEHFEKTNNPVGVRVAKLLIDKYLDIYNDTMT